jgi:hypothetical protein
MQRGREQPATRERCTPNGEKRRETKSKYALAGALIEKIRVKCVSVSVQLGCRDAGVRAFIGNIAAEAAITRESERASEPQEASMLLQPRRERAKVADACTRLGGHDAPPHPLLPARTHTHSCTLCHSERGAARSTHAGGVERRGEVAGSAAAAAGGCVRMEQQDQYPAHSRYPSYSLSLSLSSGGGGRRRRQLTKGCTARALADAEIYVGVHK